MTRSLSPLAAFDINEDGRATAITEAWPDAKPGTGARWRWLHLELSDPNMATWVQEHLPPVAANALVQAETRPRCDAHDGGIILNLRGVNMNPGQETDDMVSLRLWVTDRLIVSSRLRKIFAVDEIRKEAVAGTAPASPDAFLQRLVEGLTDRLEAVSLSLEDATDALEDAILEEDDLQATALAPTRRKVIRIRRYVGPQREALHRLTQSDNILVGPHSRQLLAESANRATRIVEELDSVSARLTALQDHLYAEHSARMSRNGYVLSVVAAIFLPLGFLTGLFGMNVAGMPGTEWAHAFAVVSMIMALIGVGLFALFRVLKWL
ncbi:zinc transporter ZntB [Actibacterium lipolyticum]|uniref:Zinc transport protein ZntB n=1 Tax=Actibacterium lipolyticum TaxID=1524263 RepID=A0A238KGJ5_9RHOB|nr:zinc transporter ZntB [Actibacterium lipolyticum]SMX41878.1 Zinc transport protein ZntB [Actibacterium lipolyticum]